MPIVVFKGLRAPYGCASSAGRQSTLYQLTGPISNHSEHTPLYQIIHKTYRVLYAWRNRLEQLKANKWMQLRTDDQLLKCMNCLPPFAVFTPHTESCRQFSICPFCYARHVINLCHVVFRIINSINKANANDYCLLGYLNSTVSDDSISHLMDLEVSSRRELYNTFNAFGGYLGSEIEPVGESEWRINRRGLLITPSDLELELDDYELIKVLSRKSKPVARLVSYIMRYPTNLMTYDNTSRVVELLHARHLHRLYASYGTFRKTIES